MAICEGCKQEIVDREKMKCHTCKQEYDLTCANVSEKRYNLFFRPCNQPREWKCPNCVCKQPKTKNDNTPIRSSTLPLPVTELQTDTMNITMRRQPKHKIENTSFSISLNDDTINPITPYSSTISEDNEQIINTSSSTIENTINENIMGDTLPPEDISNRLTLQQVSELLSKNNQDLVEHLKSAIKLEIKQAVQIFKSEITQHIDTLYCNKEKPNTNVKILEDTILKENSSIKEKLLKLELKHKEIRDELEAMKNKINSEIPIKTHKESDDNNKIVIYGIEEAYKETENLTHDLTMQVCLNLLNINLQGYIENIYRIGRKGHRRPIMVELTSKKITQRILNLSRNLKHTQISINEYLDENGLKTRKDLIEELKKARKAGKYAVIRDNKLIIEEKRNHSTTEKHGYKKEYKNYQQQHSYNYKLQHITGKYRNEEQYEGLEEPLESYNHISRQKQPQIENRENIQKDLNISTNYQRKSYAETTKYNCRNQRSYAHKYPPQPSRENQIQRAEVSQNAFLGY